jgi:hypothetical protein
LWWDPKKLPMQRDEKRPSNPEASGRKKELSRKEPGIFQE